MRDLKDVKFKYSEMEHLINENVTGKRSERNRAILKMRFLKGYTYAEIAEHFQMSEIQIGRIIHRYGDPILLMLVK